MTRVCHLLDSTAGWEQRLAISQLVERLPADVFPQSVASTDARCVDLPSVPVHLLARTSGLDVLAAPAVARFAARQDVGLIHAWGVRAALAARISTRLPLVVELFDPAAATTCEEAAFHRLPGHDLSRLLRTSR